MNTVYQLIGGLEILILMTAIARYVFLINAPQTRSGLLLFWGSFLLAETIAGAVFHSEPATALLPFLFAILFLWQGRPSRRILGMFFIIPISGMMLSLLFLPIMIVYLFTGSMNQVLDNKDIFWIPMDILFWFFCILFAVKVRRWKSRYSDSFNQRKLTQWETLLLWGIGFLLLVLFFLLSLIDEFSFTLSIARGFVIGAIVILGILLYTVVAVTIQGNRNAYFEREAALNEYYLNAQLKHFKAYQETQKQTRRIRHDMKNHMACLYALLEKGHYEEAQLYIKEMNELVNQSEEHFHTGDPMIDAILNEKTPDALSNGIRLSVEGIPQFSHMEPVDVCTIFANAMDNAIEAQKDLNDRNKWIHVSFVRQHAMQYIRIENPSNEVRKSGTSFLTEKDPKEHGFGLENIRRAVEKYDGQMNASYQNGIFVLEVLFTTK
ncbi:sensor histidine kinase [Lacrimispora sp. JR3]|uniref:sensor histidine kinase n=1 Tax=Lacrimispora sinapis TaxID=3111456 RepID=UPI0037488165